MVTHVERQEDGLGDIEAHHVERSHVGRLDGPNTAARLELVLLQGEEPGLVRLAQELKLKVQECCFARRAEAERVVKDAVAVVQYQLIEAQGEDLPVALTANARLHARCESGGRPCILFALVGKRVSQVDRLIDHRRGPDVALVLCGCRQSSRLGHRDLVRQPR